MKPHAHESARPPGAQLRLLLTLVAGLLAMSACGGDSDRSSERTHPTVQTVSLPPLGPLSADAKTEVVEAMKLDIATPRHPSDGGGRAWIEVAQRMTETGAFELAPRNERGEPVLRAGSRGRFRVVYEAGPLGVAVGGVVFLQVSPFWEWDDPQQAWPEGPGYTPISTTAEGVVLENVLGAGELLGVEIGGRPLAEGEQIDFVYGGGIAGARVDVYAETGSRLWVAVDGDGDGVRSLLQDSPTIDVRAGPPAWLIVALPTTAEPGDEIRATFAIVDGEGNAAPPFEGEIELDRPERLGLPQRVRLNAADRGRKTITGTAGEAGTVRLAVRVLDGPHPMRAVSNPLVVRPGIRRVLWGDLHGHSHLSDGTGTPDDFYQYARDVAALDVAALTDHDHWGMRFIDATPDLWNAIREAAARHYEPGRFVTLLGYEWTSWLQGHRHVLYFEDDGQVLSSMDPRYETPDQLWQALAGRKALTFAHHSAGGPVSTNWTFAPPPEIEPVTEIVSIHGVSESADAPAAIYSPVAGNFVRDAMKLGYRFGFIGSGDSHDGHPGLAGIAAQGVSGLAAIRATARTREAVLAALRARDTYATNGLRMHLEVTLEDLTDEAGSVLRFQIAGTAPLERIDFVRSGLIASVEFTTEALDWSGERKIPSLAKNEYVYLRVIQRDGGVAWSSPFYGD